MEEFNSGFTVRTKPDGSPVSSADLRSSKLISDQLKTTSIPLLGEELEKDNYNDRIQWKENWIIDPLDGTKMFIKNEPEFSVNIGLVRNGKAVFGIITDPMNQLALIGGEDLQPVIIDYSNLSHPFKITTLIAKEDTGNRLVVSCSRSFDYNSGNGFLRIIEKAHGPLQLLRKSSALKFFDLASGKSDLYPRFAPTMEWDIAPGQAIIESMGGVVLDATTNNSLTYNKESLLNPHFVVKTKAFLNK